MSLPKSTKTNRKLHISMAIAFLLLAPAMRAGGSPATETTSPIDITGWLRDASPINDCGIFHHGYVPFKSHYDPEIRKIGRAAMNLRSSDVMDLFESALLEVSGLNIGDGRTAFRQPFFAGTKHGDEDDVSMTWTSPGRYAPLLFLALEDQGGTGEESIGFYRNDEHLATYRVGNRQYRLPGQVGDSAVRMERNLLIGIMPRQRIDLDEGDRLIIRAETPGRYVFSALMFVPRPDVIKFSEHRILFPEVKVWEKGRQPSGRTGTLQFAWVTRMPSSCILIWSDKRGEVEQGSGNIAFLDGYSENFQYYADKTPAPDETVYYRVLAESNDGRRKASPVFQYTHTATPSQSAKGTIELRPVDAIDIPATSSFASIPLNKGEIFDINSLRIVNMDTQAPVSAQFRATAYHSDGSVRWLGSHFSVEKNGLYALEYGPGIHPFSTVGLETSRSVDTFTVSGKHLDVTFSPEASAGLAQLDVSSGETALSFGPDNMRIFIEGHCNTRFTAGKPSSLEMEHSGPEHVTVRAEGHFVTDDGEPLMHYILRWKLYRDKPGIGIELIVGNDRDEDKYASYPPVGRAASNVYRTQPKKLNWYFVNIRCLYIELDMPPRGDVLAGITEGEVQRRVGFIEKENLYRSSTNGRLNLFQRDADRVIDRTVLSEKEELESIQLDNDGGFVGSAGTGTARLDGRLLWSDGNNVAGVKFDRFWQNYPKGYEFNGDTIRIGIMPSYNHEYYPVHRLNHETNELPAWSDTSRIHFFLRHGMYRFMYGKQKTHQLSLLFGDETEQFLSQETVIPPVAFFMPPPAYKCSVNAVGDFTRIKADTGKYPAINEFMSTMYGIFDGRAYGMMNFGDVFGERQTNWQNLQVDFAQAASKEFWRTGQRRWLGMAYESALHFADIDTKNYGPNRGCQLVHAVCHTGGEYLMQEGFIVRGYPHGIPTNHMSIRGIRNMELISGSGRLKESREQFSEFISGSAASHLKSVLGNRGYNIQNSFMCFEVESNPFDLNASRIAFERVMTDLDAGNPEYTSAPLGYREATGDNRVDRMVEIRTRHAGSGWDEHLKIHFRGIRHEGRHTHTGPTVAGGEAYLVTGDARYRQMLEETTAYGLTAPVRNWAPNQMQAVQFFGESSTTWSPIPTLTYYLNAAGLESIEPRELPEETLDWLPDR